MLNALTQSFKFGSSRKGLYTACKCYGNNSSKFKLWIEHHAKLWKWPRRQEFDGYTYFGVEDGTKNEDDEDESSKDGAGATGGYIEDASG